MLPRLCLLVGSDQGTDRQTMSVIELSLTAKKLYGVLSLPPPPFPLKETGQSKETIFLLPSLSSDGRVSSISIVSNATDKDDCLGNRDRDTNVIFGLAMPGFLRVVCISQSLSV